MLGWSKRAPAVTEAGDRIGQAGMMGRDHSASPEQTAGIEQVNVAVVQMDRVTQQSAALVPGRGGQRIPHWQAARLARQPVRGALPAA